MFKKSLLLLGVTFFLSCGGESSKEARELLEKILTVIGIPPSVISNICQTSNNSDICEGMTLYTNGKNNKEKMWNKITETGEGQYLLETNTPCEPILLSLKDDDVEYDNGDFFLKFSGVAYGVYEKELSILEAMVDASYISSSSVVSIKKLNSTEAQNSFYATLYRDLKTNINILKEKDLTKVQAIRGTLKEMADELLSAGINQQLPTILNSCGDNSICITQELDRLSNRLLIDSKESEEIYMAQKDNSNSLYVREISCEEPKEKSPNNKLLSKVTSYNANGTKTDESQFTYENDRIKEWVWYDFEENSNDKWIYSYSQDKIKVFVENNESYYWEQLLNNGLVDEMRWYGGENNEYNWSQKIVERDNQNRPIKMEESWDYNNEKTQRGIVTYRYDGEYMVHYENTDLNPEYYDSTEYYDYTYNREHRCITIKELTGQVSWFWGDSEVCINWISRKVTNNRDNSSYTETQEITYNADGLPSRIDSYEYISDTQKSEHTYDIWEYND